MTKRKNLVFSVTPSEVSNVDTLRLSSPSNTSSLGAGPSEAPSSRGDGSASTLSLSLSCSFASNLSIIGRRGSWGDALSKPL